MTDQDSNFVDLMIPVDPNATMMKLISVPRGTQFVINIDGSHDIIEIVNPTDGRKPYFRLRETVRVSEKIELDRMEQEDEAS
ncbi:MAG: hypothetical protein U9R53_10900 [Chloroflexota bacterium]|nr:hypothetical protein [Chloroflexota bacterium]